MAQQPHTQTKSSSGLTLPSLPTKLSFSQCISFQEEILICGGVHNINCYSYHIQKQQYKLICSYPDHVRLDGHTVIAIPSSFDFNFNFNSKHDTRTITLLSFGGSARWSIQYHTMVMNYQSVWDEKL